MSFKNTIGIALGAAIGIGTGFLVYKVCTAQTIDTPPQGLPINNNPSTSSAESNSGESASDVIKNKLEEHGESKGEILRQGLKSAATACTVASAAAQCVSGIADNISRMSSIINNPTCYSQQPQNYYPGMMFNNPSSFCGGGFGFYNPMMTNSNPTWNRVNPIMVATNSGGGGFNNGTPF